MLRHSGRLALALLVLTVASPLAAAEKAPNAKADYPSFGKVERVDPKLDALVAKDAVIEKLSDGYDWSEGPVWLQKEQTLLFSDVPMNSVFQWKEGSSASLRLKPSGYTGKTELVGEPGSNGLTVDAKGRLVLCQHGDRRVARLAEDGKSFVTLADRFEGKRFNSPNDLAYHSNGDLYFTDPPYGLPKKNDDPNKDIPFNGVYRLSKDGKVSLLTKALSYPNGIAFSPDEKTLYVANSDPAKAIWMAYPVLADGMIGEGKVFFDATKWVSAERKGLPDGMKVDASGNLFASGPGGILIFSAEGTHLGTINTGEATANCAWGDDGSTLYMTADMYLARIKLKTKRPGF